MTGLPVSIEAYLKEAGFTSTELLIIKHLLTGEALTLREMASKLGKSTGVLDQACKKLFLKRILRRAPVNGSMKYALISLESLTQWMEDDMRRKSDEMKRKHKDFASFISTVKLDTSRPDLEHFEGEEEMKRAYMRLLEYKQTLLQYYPVTCKEECDPLYDFRVQFFRERRKRGIFSKVLTHDTPLGRRFLSRDHFEYRETRLVCSHECDLPFEKIIVGDTVACFDHTEKRACFIRFPQLAETEEFFFYTLWEGKELSSPPPKDTPAPLCTQLLSSLRECFISPKSLCITLLFAILSTALTYTLYNRNAELNTERVREKVLAIASTGAPLFNAEDLDALRTREDVEKEEYRRVVERLERIKMSNPSIEYVYLMRPINESVFEFIADADGGDIAELLSYSEQEIEESEITPFPGLEYETENDPDLLKALIRPIANNEPTQDAWGTWISGFSPIFKGSTAVAILGVDIDVEELNRLNNESFQPICAFLFFLFIFVFIRFIIINNTLLCNICKYWKNTVKKWAIE